MAPTILVVSATGNTGRGAVETLSKLLSTSNALPGHRILALTRSLNGTVAQQLAQLPSVEAAEKNWVEITDAWLRQNNVVRAFVAPHFEPTQFPEESAFHLAALRAGVQYVVRISTTATNVRPDCAAFHGRTHWAIEALLSSPEFQGLQWTSLQPNGFSTFNLASAAALVKKYRKTGVQDTLSLPASKDAPVAMIDANDVGVFAAHLLCEEDPARHNRAKYVLNGPEDITGRQIVEMVEHHIGTRVEDVLYKDVSFVDQMAAASPESRHLILSIRYASETYWRGECKAATTSKEVLEIAAPKGTPAMVFEAMLKSED